MKRFLTITTIFVMLIIVRVILNGSSNLIYIIAIINIFALIFVVSDLIEKIINKLKTIKNDFPEEIVKREFKNKRKKLIISATTICMFFSIIYLVLLVSNLGNDIISIIAVGASLIENDIVQLITTKLKGE